jgi:hypothetical protein
MIYLNASDEAACQASKPFYHDPERLLAARTHGRGVRTLLLKLIDHVVARRMPVRTSRPDQRLLTERCRTTRLMPARIEVNLLLHQVGLCRLVDQNPIKPISVKDKDEPDVREDLLEVVFGRALG